MRARCVRIALDSAAASDAHGYFQIDWNPHLASCDYSSSVTPTPTLSLLFPMASTPADALVAAFLAPVDLSEVVRVVRGDVNLGPHAWGETLQRMGKLRALSTTGVWLDGLLDTCLAAPTVLFPHLQTLRLELGEFNCDGKPTVQAHYGVSGALCIPHLVRALQRRRDQGGAPLKCLAIATAAHGDAERLWEEKVLLLQGSGVAERVEFCVVQRGCWASSMWRWWTTE